MAQTTVFCEIVNFSNSLRQQIKQSAGLRKAKKMSLELEVKQTKNPLEFSNILEIEIIHNVLLCFSLRIII